MKAICWLSTTEIKDEAACSGWVGLAGSVLPVMECLGLSLVLSLLLAWSHEEIVFFGNLAACLTARLVFCQFNWAQLTAAPEHQRSTWLGGELTVKREQRLLCVGIALNVWIGSDHNVQLYLHILAMHFSSHTGKGIMRRLASTCGTQPQQGTQPQTQQGVSAVNQSLYNKTRKN